MLEELNKLSEIYPGNTFERLILRCDMCFCQVYVRTAHGLTGLWKFSAVVPHFWSPTSILVNFLKSLPLRNMLKGKKAASTFIILHLDLYSSLIPFRNKSLTSIALGSASYGR